MKNVYSLIAFICLSFQASSQSVSFSYTGGLQSYTVPTGVTQIGVDAMGGCGGGAYVSAGSEGPVALGGRVQCNMAVTPGQVLYINVGGGVTGFAWSSNNPGGFNGGGTSGTYAGAGGGASDIRLTPDTISGNQVIPYTATNRIVVAGAGGGGGDFSAPGGLGGGLTGGDGGVNSFGFSGIAGSGGTQTGIGAVGLPGGLGYGGDGSSYSGGGGGGGLYGGNGANGYNGGGGGSSYTDPVLCTSVIHTQGYSGANGNGLVILCPFPNPGTITGVPVICSSGSGSTTTLSDPSGDLGGVWSSSDNSIATVGSSSGIVSGVAAGTATISYTVTSACGSSTATATVTVNQTPDVTPSSNQTNCNGEMTTSITFTNFATSVPGTVFNWTNPNTSIGLAASGVDSIPAFTITDTSSSSVLTVTINVTPTANGCTGGSNTFEFIVKPTPVFTSTLTPPAICDGTTFSYTPSATTGLTTTFDWSRAAVTGIGNAAGSGTGDPTEVLYDTTAGPVAAVYVYTLSASGCTNVQNVTVTVNATPKLSGTLTPAAICDSTLFTYTQASATTDVAYAWSRAAITGIANPAASGTGDINEYLFDTTLGPVTVTYVDTLTDTVTGCMNVQSINLAVNARPMLSSPLTLSPVCDSTTITYVPTSDVSGGATFAWSRAAIDANPAASGVDTIMEMLVDTSANPILVQYVDTITSIVSGCSYVQTVSVSVNPTPVLSSLLNPIPAGICDSMQFNYTPTSRTVGATFAWDRPYTTGLGLPAGSGTGVINEYLKNNTNNNLDVVYVYTVTINGCSHVQDVSVISHPTPTLATTTGISSCSGASVNYTPLGYVFGTTFAWHRAAVSGITPATGSGTGGIGETLTDSALVPLTSVYVYTLTANGCTHTQNVVVTVNPTPSAIAITTHPPANLCDNTMYQNFGVASVPPNQTYHWTATNATVWAQGSNHQYALVTFDHPGTAVVTLEANVSGIGCKTNNSFTVNVGTSSAEVPLVTYFQGQFLCLQTDEDNYQWGFDDNTTLDSTIIEGEKNPNYINMTPDFGNRHYWVITNKNGCMQKTYYNPPTDIKPVSEDVSLRVYPNPAESVLNVEITSQENGKYELGIVNMLGQKVSGAVAEDRKAAIDVAGLPAGCYLVDCYRDGIKIAAVRFIKN